MIFNLVPKGGCNDESHPDEVHENHVQQELHKPPEMNSEHEGEASLVNNKCMY